MERMRMETINLVSENVKKIQKIFPDCVTEIRDENGACKKAIHFEMLRQYLSEDIADSDQVYEFTWPGKKAAMVEANKPIKKTLRPSVSESIDWNTTENLYIEGDNLDALKLLQESYLGQVQIMYIDPPYNTGADSFTYPDDYSISKKEYDAEIGSYDADGNKVFTENNRTNPQFHSKWCSMIYQRLLLARNLLADDGVIFISIDDNEESNLVKICNEIFGEDNFIAVFPRLTTKSGKTPLAYMISHDYVLCYTKLRKDIFVGKPYSDDSYKYEDEYVAERGRYNLKQPLDCNSISYSKALDYPIEHEGKTYYPGSDYEKYRERKMGKHLNKDYAWRWSKDLFEFGLANGWIVFQNGRIYTKGYLNATIEKQPDGTYGIAYREKTRIMSTIDFISNDYSNDIAKKQLAAYQIPVKFDYPKPVDLIVQLLSTHYDKDALVMDFFSGSGTTAEAVFKLNEEDGGKRRFLLIQYPEDTGDREYPTICSVAKERIRLAGEKENTGKEKGFRVFQVDTTNMKDVYYRAEDYSQSMLAILESNIKEDRTDLDLLFGCLLEWGLPLNLPYTSETMEGCIIHTYNGGDLIACFNENIPYTVIEAVAKRRPRRAVFRDSSFSNSPSKLNVSEIFRLLTPDTRVKVI